MLMKNLWLRQSVNGWVLFLGVLSVWWLQTTKTKEMTKASELVSLLLAMALHVTSGQKVNKGIKSKENRLNN